MQGFNFYPLGPEVDFLGKVRPYVLDVSEVEESGMFEFPFPYERARRDIPLRLSERELVSYAR